ncbi:MAG: hypothetical protein U1A78_25095 [Polyangia bacterium]
MVYPGVAAQLAPRCFAALIHTVIGRSLGAGPLGWPLRLFIAAGAAMAVGGSTFIGVIWYDMIRNGRRADLGTLLLAFILGVGLAAGTLLGAFLSAGAPGGARRRGRWAGPVGALGSIAVVLYGFFYRW